MKVFSWNVNGIRAAHKKGFLDFWKDYQPDILCLQETKAHKEQLTPEMLRPFNFESYFSSAVRKGYSGTATFLREPSTEIEYGINIDRFDSEGRFVVTTFKDIKIFNMYFPNGASGPERHNYKMDFLKSFSKYIEPLVVRGEKIIVLGDYNIAPQDIDIYDPIKHAKTSGFKPEEKEWFQSFLNIGFVDSFRHLHPDEGHRFSWWNQMERARLGNRGWRIDLICITKNLIPSLVKADIHDEVMGSDHCPISITLKE